jgi:hypothetical protein
MRKALWGERMRCDEILAHSQRRLAHKVGFAKRLTVWWRRRDACSERSGVALEVRFGWEGCQLSYE